MSIRTDTSDLDFMRRTIEGAIRSRVTEVIAEEAEAAASRVSIRIKQETANIVLAVFSSYSVARMGADIVIIVKGMPANASEATT